MSEQLRNARVACMRDTEEHFFAAVKPPFFESEEGYKRLSENAIEIKKLREGSQVFVYLRGSFGWNAADRIGDFRQSVKKITSGLGNIALDPEVTTVESKQTPQPVFAERF